MGRTGSITDISGITVGHATDHVARTGVTVVLFDQSTMGACLILGSAVSTRGFESLHGRGVAKPIHGVCFAGGSSFGLAATGGVQRYLREQGRGLRTGDRVIPLVPTAIIFDLHVGTPDVTPSEDTGYVACQNAARSVEEGNVGAGTGAVVGKLLGDTCGMVGGVGTASRSVGEVIVGALAVCNAYGDVRDPDTGRIIAGARLNETSTQLLDTTEALRRGQAPSYTSNTTLVLLATNAALSPVQCEVIARQASAGFARTIAPVFSEIDGDLLVCVSSGTRKAPSSMVLGQLGSDVVAEAIVRSVTSARSVDGLPCAADLGSQ